MKRKLYDSTALRGAPLCWSQYVAVRHDSLHLQLVVAFIVRKALPNLDAMSTPQRT
jgi:hypothetical protein